MNHHSLHVPPSCHVTSHITRVTTPFCVLGSWVLTCQVDELMIVDQEQGKMSVKAARVSLPPESLPGYSIINAGEDFLAPVPCPALPCPALLALPCLSLQWYSPCLVSASVFEISCCRVPFEIQYPSLPATLSDFGFVVDVSELYHIDCGLRYVRYTLNESFQNGAVFFSPVN